MLTWGLNWVFVIQLGFTMRSRRKQKSKPPAWRRSKRCESTQVGLVVNPLCSTSGHLRYVVPRSKVLTLHPTAYLSPSVSLSVCLYVCPRVCPCLLFSAYKYPSVHILLLLVYVCFLLCRSTSVNTSLCQPACLLVYLSVCTSVCLFVCPYTVICISVRFCFTGYLSITLSTNRYLPACICVSVYLSAYLPIPVCLSTFLPA